MKICIIGFGFVGNAIYNSLLIRNFKKDINLFIYDKYKNGGIGKINYETDIMFLCLPTPYDEEKCQYNIDSIIETCDILKNNNYKGVIVLKSTVEPETTFNLSSIYSNLNIFHNPEFLTTNTSIEDFNNQKHIVIGSPYNENDDKYNKIHTLIDFYKKYYPDADISLCKSIDSESMKIFCNSFYAIKIQFFTELYLLCKKNNSDFEKIKELMLKNNWINPMHTKVPGPDGQISYGGLCLPKDILALNSYMLKNNSENNIIQSTINERNILRK
jgi:UDPglucose 6-dehydrogenase